MNIELGRLAATDSQVLNDQLIGSDRRSRRSKEAICILLCVTMLAGDILLLSAAFIAAGWLRFGNPLAHQIGTMLLMTIPLFVLIAISNQTYAREVLVDRRNAIRRAVKSLALVAFAVIGAAYCLKITEDLSRLALAGGLTAALGLLVPARVAMVALADRLLDGKAISEIVIHEGVEFRPYCPPLVPTVDATLFGLVPEVRSPEMLDRIGRVIHRYDRIIIACPPERRYAWAQAVKGSGANVELLAPELDHIGMLGAAHYHGGVTTIVSLDTLGLHDRMLKRALDLAVVLTLLPVVIPMIALIAIILKLDTRGPAFFVQERVGWGNRLFKMYKFRSMWFEKTDHSGFRSASRRDDRITPVGGFLRRTSLDELPQLINVLKGDMSIVGPRPHAVGSTAEDRLFWEVDERYFNRHAVKPGLTGLAQVRGFRGATLTSMDLSNRVQADLEYLSGWTIWRDLSIIIRTLKVIVHRNAF